MKYVLSFIPFLFVNTTQEHCAIAVRTSHKPISDQYHIQWSSPTSGQVNFYAPVLSICQNEFTVSSTNGFEKGDKIMMIQMQGASADLTDTESFGNITNLNSCGKYEFLTIKSVKGTTITTTEQPLNSYD